MDRFIFVDDGDPSILYMPDDSWTVGKGLQTQLKGINPSNFHAPWYGTLHTSRDPSFDGTPSLSYVFNGTAITAYFLSNNIRGITSCAIDGMPQNITAGGTGGVICTNKAPLVSGIHNITIKTGADMAFDGFIVTPTVFPDSGVDVIYGNTSNAFPDVGSNFTAREFSFHGASVGIYGTMYFAPGINVSLSYSIDDAPTLDWSVSINADALTEAYSDQLFIQTPTLPMSNHTLKFTITHPNDSWIEPNMFIVQNKTQDRNLDPIPPINTAASPVTSSIAGTSTVHADHGLSGGSIAGITVSIVVGITVIMMGAIWIARRLLQMRSSNSSKVPSNPVTPFDSAHSSGPSRFRIAQYETREKTNKYRDAFGIPNMGSSNHTETEVTTSSSVHTGDLVRQADRVRYRIHEDGGGLVAEANEEERIVDLPPVYSTLRTATLSGP